MIVKKNDIAVLRDGRKVFVTDAADQHPDAWRWYSYRLGRDAEGNAFEEEYVAAEMPAETIFVGHPISDTLVVNENATIVSDMSEVVSILN